MSFSDDGLRKESLEFDRVDDEGENFKVNVGSEGFGMRGEKTRMYGKDPVYRFFWSTDKTGLQFTDYVRDIDQTVQNVEAYVYDEERDVKLWDNAVLEELEAGSEISVRGKTYRVAELSDILFMADELNLGWSFGIETPTEAYLETKSEMDITGYVSREVPELDISETEKVARTVQQDLYDHEFTWADPLS